MIIDSHCHLHDPAFEDLRGSLARAAEHDVWGVVAVGCDQESNARTLEAATANGKSVWPAVGFHPDWTQLTDLDLERVEAQVTAHHARLVALGEIGLPWYCLEGATDAAGLMTRGRQRFKRLLGLAARYDLPVILHAPHGAAVGALEAVKADWIVTAAASCAIAIMHDYADLLRDDPEWAGRAARISALCKDISEVLIDLGLGRCRLGGSRQIRRCRPAAPGIFRACRDRFRRPAARYHC